MAHRSIDGDRQGVHLDRLADEVVRARADGGDGRLQAPKRREHDDGHVGPVLDDGPAQVDAAHPLHVEVGDDDVEVFLADGVPGGRRVRVRRHAVAALAKAERERLDQIGVVVDEQDVTHDPACLGKNTRKVEPRSTLLSTVIHPPCSRTIP